MICIKPNKEMPRIIIEERIISRQALASSYGEVPRIIVGQSGKGMSMILCKLEEYSLAKGYKIVNLTDRINQFNSSCIKWKSPK